MPEIKLKHCPFCGKSVATICTVAEKDGDDGNEWSNTHYVAVCNYNAGGCGSCGTCDNQTPEKAAEAWNRRACDTKELHAYWIPSKYGCKCSMCQKEFLAEDAAKLYECPNCKSQMGEPRKGGKR